MYKTASRISLNAFRKGPWIWMHGDMKTSQDLSLADGLKGGICSRRVAVFKTYCFPDKVHQLSSSPPILGRLHLNNLRGTEIILRSPPLCFYSSWLVVFCTHMALERVTSGMGINSPRSETLLTLVIPCGTSLCLDPGRKLEKCIPSQLLWLPPV